jgi:hypothetical protein
VRGWVGSWEEIIASLNFEQYQVLASGGNRFRQFSQELLCAGFGVFDLRDLLQKGCGGHSPLPLLVSHCAQLGRRLVRILRGASASAAPGP